MNNQNTIPLPSESKTGQANVSINKTNSLNSVMVPDSLSKTSPSQGIFSQRNMNFNDFIPRQEAEAPAITKPFSNVIQSNTSNPTPKSATQDVRQNSTQLVQRTSVTPSQSATENIANNRSVQENYYDIQNNPMKTIVGNTNLESKQNTDLIKNNSSNVYSITANKIQKSAMESVREPTPPAPSSQIGGVTPMATGNQVSSSPSGSRRRTTIDEAMIGSAMLPLWRQRFNG